MTPIKTKREFRVGPSVGPSVRLSVRPSEYLPLHTFRSLILFLVVNSKLAYCFLSVRRDATATHLPIIASFFAFSSYQTREERGSEETGRREERWGGRRREVKRQGGGRERVGREGREGMSQGGVLR